MRSTTKRQIPKIKGHVNHVFNGDLICLMGRTINRLIDEVNSMDAEMTDLRSHIIELEKRGNSNEESNL